MYSKEELEQLNQKQLLDLASALHALQYKVTYANQEFLFTAESKKKYAKAWAFFEAGKHFKERAIIAGNRTGKTYTAMAELSFHLNGRYPPEWPGRKFNHPIQSWVVGESHDTVKTILQKYLLGDFYDYGNGMIPKKDIFKKTLKPGVQDAVQDIYITHYTNGVKDGLSQVTFMSYIQGLGAFKGHPGLHVVCLDEEPPDREIYSECLTRTMTTDGIVICTFTPQRGMSELVQSFLPGGKFPPEGYGEVRGAK